MWPIFAVILIARNYCIKKFYDNELNTFLQFLQPFVVVYPILKAVAHVCVMLNMNQCYSPEAINYGTMRY